MISEDLEKRIYGIEHILHGIHHNVELLNFMSFALHQKTFSLSNNIGLYWIWASLMGETIVDFYKLIGKKEKHSFEKILNLIEADKIDIDFASLRSKVKTLTDIYEKSDFELVRSKYLAHQDINVPEIKTEVPQIDAFKTASIELFEDLTKQIERKNAPFSSDVKDAIAKIFMTVDKYELIKAFLLSNKLEGNSTVQIDEIIALLDEK